jgi:hypothetical protein
MRHHVARTLKEAKTWARPHWQPCLLMALLLGLPAQHPGHALLREAVMGDPIAFLALLDALEETGKILHRGVLTGWARQEHLFIQELPETEDERRLTGEEWRLGAARIALFTARHFYENHRSCSWGYASWSRYFPYYSTTRFYGPDLRRRMLQAACERLRAEGIGVLVEAFYPVSGEDAGYTVVILFDAQTTEQQDRVLEVMDQAFTDEVEKAIQDSTQR